MAVTNMIVGAQSPSGATFVAKVTGGGPVRVAVADNAGMGGAVFTTSQAVDAQGVAKVSITGLASDTRFWWQVEDNGTIDTAVTGQFLTDPPLGLPASFTVAMASCAGGSASVPGPAGALVPTRISDHLVFDTIRTRALPGNWRRWCSLGDLAYYNPGSGEFTADASLTTYRRVYDDILLTRQHQLYREVGLDYIWDDHDFGPNNSDGTHVDKANAAQVYRERVPHVTLPDGSAIYHSFQIGRTLFVAADCRYDRSPNTDPDGPAKTMLGTAQKAWLEALLTTTDAELLVWLMGSQWRWPDAVSGVDTWANFATERDELVTMLGDTGWLGKMAMVYGDRHAAGIDSGGSNEWGNFPLLVASSLDSDTGANLTDFYDVLDDTNGRDQYGTVQVTDIGSAIQVRLTAWRGATELGSHQFGFAISSATTVASGALLRTLTGSHTPLIEARIVTGHPTGDDPDGVPLKVANPGGDVIYDATGDVRASMSLHILGVDESNGESLFPRLPTDQLAPYGIEVFLRYGIDLGGAGVLWTPLGYFRPTRSRQQSAPYGGITLTGKDRMAGIIRAKLLAPRTYTAEQTLGAVVADLIADVFPTTIIAWDDDSDQDQLGRVLVVEESRHAGLKDIADSRGKLLYVDDEGVFRIETAPDEHIPLWQVRSGRDGVLAEVGRELSTEEINNAVVVIGQAADDQLPARAVAVDNNPQSPTYWHGDFGQAPRQYESPLIRNTDQATSAAISILRRSLGAPYTVDFGASTNPTLRPWHPVEVTYRDGNQDVVVMQRVRIPLGRQPMDGTGRMSILANVGSLT